MIKVSLARIYFALIVFVSGSNFMLFAGDIGVNDLEALESIGEQERRLLNKQRDISRKKELRQERPTGAEIDKLKIPLKDKDSGICFSTNRVEVKGVNLFSPEKINSLVSHYEESCIGKTEINNILSELTNLYITHGYVTTRAYIPAQDLQDGTLDIVVLEGKLEKIAEKNNKTDISFNNIFPSLEGKTLNMRDIEQGLDQLNRMPINAKAQIQPGSNAGESNIVISKGHARRFFPWISIDNSGSKISGVHIFNLGTSVNNLFGASNILSASFHINTDYTQNKRANRRWSLNYDMPYGYWNFMISGGADNVVSMITGDKIKFLSESANWNTNISTKRLVYRDQKTKIIMGFGLHTKRKKSFVNKAKIETGTYKRHYASLFASFSKILKNLSIIYVKGEISQGVKRDVVFHNNLGVLSDPPPDYPGDHYTKVTSDINLQKGFKIGNLATSFSLTLRGQYSTDILFGDDIFQLGGPSTVLGYKDNNLAYKSGINVRNKLTLVGLKDILPFKLIPYPYVGLDYGKVFDKSISKGNRSISSIVAGFSLRFTNKLSLTLDFGSALHYPKSFKKREKFVGLAISYAF